MTNLETKCARAYEANLYKTASDYQEERDMSNMGYCRFENTLRDLRDCYDHMDEELSESEMRAKKKLITLCSEIALDFEDEGE